jgi:proteasome lid subunit RPN8/RPN11
VTRGWPERLQFGGQPLIEAEAFLAAALPEEGCVLLLGSAQDRHWRVLEVWPCLNSWQPPSERRCRFAIDPREQLQAQKWARSRGWQVLGSLHSHPISEPVPSACDERLAVRPCLLVIAAPASGSAATGVGSRQRWRLRAWWLGDGLPGAGGGCFDQGTGVPVRLEIPMLSPLSADGDTPP